MGTCHVLFPIFTRVSHQRGSQSRDKDYLFLFFWRKMSVLNFLFFVARNSLFEPVSISRFGTKLDKFSGFTRKWTVLVKWKSV